MTGMKTMQRVLMGFLIASFAIGSAWAQTTSRLDEILARGTLRVGLTGDYQPFSVLDKSNGQYVGIDVDMANALAASLGVKLAIVPTAWRDMLADVKAGQFDIGMGGIAVTLDWQKSALFSASVIRTGKAALVRCTAKTRFYSLATIDRPGVRIVVNPGGANERFAQTGISNAQVAVFNERTPILDELIAGRADVIIMDAMETRLQQKLNPTLCAVNADKPYDFAELAYLLPRDVVWQQYVNQWLRVSTETGAYRKIVDHYVK
jgi:cyclohexadienyl dehydratase